MSECSRKSTSNIENNNRSSSLPDNKCLNNLRINLILTEFIFYIKSLISYLSLFNGESKLMQLTDSLVGLKRRGRASAKDLQYDVYDNSDG